ncbi:MAG: carboxylate-amine ligase [Gemmatimonadota bacterium]
MKAPSLTLGIEEEYQVVDPESRELTSYITEILDSEHLVLREQMKPELHQSVVEMASTVCENVQDARAEVLKMRKLVSSKVAESGLRIVAAGTHPFSSWTEQEITPLQRYIGLREDLQEVAARNLIFGMHVHVGIEDREFLIDAMNVSRYFLPHVLALSASSPFWEGRRTGLHSYRTINWTNFPRTGLPLTFNSYGEYEYLIDTLVRANTIPDSSKIWWDVRPNHTYPTLEFRICDMCTRVDEVVCVAAIFQALVAKLWKLRRDNLTFRHYPSTLISENKWRAARYGITGNMIDFGKQVEKPAPDLIREFIGWFLDDVVDELGSRTEVEYALRILDEGNSSQRQLAVFEETGDLKAVVDHLIAETADGV